ncbi:MAG: glucosidase [Pirellulaceae bacterium]
MNTEQKRRIEDRDRVKPWHKWGPYLSERQWGTVREDYSSYGEAWEYVSHDAARSRAYRWGEDGIAGLSDHHQLLCFALALWNGKDSILKERMFGLTGNEGNHGEDVKEAYYYLDGTPTNSYLKMLYKYPQRAFPYSELVSRNRTGKDQPEFELIDTGVFEEDRYFDVFVEYAKAAPEDILVRVTVHNRGPDAADLHLLPQLWFRNTWSWGREHDGKPAMSLKPSGHVDVSHPKLGEFQFFAEQATEYLFCENESNSNRLFGTEAVGCFKDAFHEYVVNGNEQAVNAHQRGTKCAAHYRFSIPAGGSQTIRLRLSKEKPADPFGDFDSEFQRRQREADEFYADLQRDIEDEDTRAVQRQAFAGLIWGKQFYYFDIQQWLDGDPAQPPPPESRKQGRNHDWFHLNNADVISMPDKWEYPWYAAWDLAFHCIPFALIDAEFAKRQLVLMTREWYMHPSGQIPAYEWAFGDVNPPVHAWATWRVYQMDRKYNGKADRAFLERVFHKCLLNFNWWVNRKDTDGRNVFQGGFLGLDNIGVFDRSAPIDGGGHLDQSDGTSWMAMYSLNMMRMALELALENPVYEDIATKFFEHFLYIAKAMTHVGEAGTGLWNEEDEFFYDVLHLPTGETIPLKIRSLVGLTPLFAVETLEPELLERLPAFARRLNWTMKNRPELASLVSRWHEPGRGERRLLSLLRGHRVKCLLKRMLDESEFLSDYGIRAISKVHEGTPYRLFCDGNHVRCQGEALTVDYQPAESNTSMFGGNSNWRGPIWFPMNYLLVESLQKFHHYYGDDFKIECPVGSGKYLSFNEVAAEISRRLSRIFLKDESGRRAVYKHHPRMQTDPHFRDHIWFYEYFHGDIGRGVGATHQTGWTALVAKLMQPRKET